MRVDKTVVRPATEEKRLDFIQCDLCRARSNKGGTFGGECDWASGSFDVAEMTIKMAEGAAYPEGGSIRYTVVDVCLNCFKTAVLPLLRELGAVPRMTESEW